MTHFVSSVSSMFASAESVEAASCCTSSMTLRAMMDAALSASIFAILGLMIRLQSIIIIRLPSHMRVPEEQTAAS